jgi:hypothetical protein
MLVDWSKSQIGLCKLIPKRVFLVGVSIFNLNGKFIGGLKFTLHGFSYVWLLTN